MIVTRDELRGWTPLELSTLAIWNEQKGGGTARQANSAIEELERRANALDALREAVKPVLTAYRHTGDGHITEEQITAAWKAFDA